jgi:hypothetical protein
MAVDPAIQKWSLLRVLDEFLKVVYTLCEDALDCGSDNLQDGRESNTAVRRRIPQSRSHCLRASNAASQRKWVNQSITVPRV